jgi:hypothetical protein
MAAECHSRSGFVFQRKLSVDFQGGEITGEAGLVLVREFETQGIRRSTQSSTWPEHSIVEEEVDARLGHESGELLDQLVRLEEDRSRAVVPGAPHREQDFPITGELESSLTRGEPTSWQPRGEGSPTLSREPVPRGAVTPHFGAP